MPRWEYRLVLVSFGDDEGEEELNRLGAEGWELVSIVPRASSTGPGAVGVAALKRSLEYRDD
jgi:hypothetical protein